jgi:type IV pilus assembly protein PilF
VSNLARIIVVLMICIGIHACKQSGEDLDEQSPKVEKAQKAKKLSNAAVYNTQLGMGYLKQGNIPRAKRKLLMAMEQDPHSPDVFTAMAYFYEKTSEFDKAKTYYLKAIALAPESGAQMNNYGAFLCGRGDYKEAESYFLKAINNNQYLNTSSAYENAGLCSAAASDFVKARHYLTKAIEQDPNKNTAFTELVKMEEKTGDFKQAVSLLERYPELVANDKSMLNLAKNIAHKAQRPDLEAFYMQKMQNVGQFAQNSGVNNEYNNVG